MRGPGILNRVAVMRPPETLPTYIETSSTMAESPDSPKVKGRESAMSMAPVRPGIAPTVIPKSVPKTVMSSSSGELKNAWTSENVVGTD